MTKRITHYNVPMSISPSARVAHDRVIMGNNVTVGTGSHIYSNVMIGHNVHIGKHCTVDSGSVIGDGSILENSRVNNFCRIGKKVVLQSASIYDDCVIGDNIQLDRRAVTLILMRENWHVYAIDPTDPMTSIIALRFGEIMSFVKTKNGLPAMLFKFDEPTKPILKVSEPWED